MAKIDKDSLAYLGMDYQLKLMAQILTDKNFANSIIDIIDPNYFEEQYIKIIAATIKDAKAKDATAKNAKDKPKSTFLFQKE